MTVFFYIRPEILVNLKENHENKYLGKVMHEWSYNMNSKLYDQNNQLKYKVTGKNKCQHCLLYFCLFFHCRCCNQCSLIKFIIENNNGQIVGEIIKVIFTI